MTGYTMDKYNEIKFNNKYKASEKAVDAEIKVGIDEIISNPELTVDQTAELVVDMVNKNVDSRGVSDQEAAELATNASNYYNLSLMKKAQEGEFVDEEKLTEEQKAEAEKELTKTQHKQQKHVESGKQQKVQPMRKALQK